MFVTLSTLLCLFMAVWAFGFAPVDGGAMVSVLGIVGVIGTIGLPVYGVYFSRKVKDLII